MKLFKSLYFYVLLSILAGGIVGWLYPSLGIELKFLGELFIRLIKMLVGPLIFITIVLGIGGVKDLKKLGRTGLKTLVYFELVTTLAMFIGWGVTKIVGPGEGMNLIPASLPIEELSSYTDKCSSLQQNSFINQLIPENIVAAFANNDILPILFLAILVGVVLSQMGDGAKPIVGFFEHANTLLFKIIDLFMKVAPIGAFGAMAYTIGKFGTGSLYSLGKLMACLYGTCFLFVFIVLGSIVRYSGTSIWKLLVYIKEEILLVLGTSSSETVLPKIMQKLNKAGCSSSISGLVIPTGYSFNLDGTSIYLTMAALFIAQATNTHLTVADELALFGLFLLTSKGAAAITGGGFIVLTSSLTTFGKLPIEALVVLIGIDRFMSEARAITNLIGNTVATLVIAKSENELDQEILRREVH